MLEAVESMDANLVYLAWVIGLTAAGFVGLHSVGRAYRGVAAFLNLDEASWWRTTLPWPHGVQEDDEVHFHVEAVSATRPATRPAAAPAGTVEDLTDGGADLQPVRPDRRVRIR
jgi:hypothetical protein